MVCLIGSQSELEGQLRDAGEKLVVVDFFATWCGPCKMIAPKIEEWSKSMDNVVFLKVDVDDTDDVAQKYEISAMPTFKFFKNGEVVGEVMGANVDALKTAIEKYSK